MNHPTDEELFRLIDGEATPEERTAYRAHLGRCPACQHLHRELMATERWMVALPLENPPADFADRLMEKLQPAGTFLSYRSPNSLNFLLGAIGLTLLGLAVSLALAGQISLPTSAGGIGGTGVRLDFSFFTLFQSPLVKNVLLVTNGILALLVFDKRVLRPFFHRWRTAV
ncbi:MAG: zf-HC2 domain-containing protein [Ferruginibacter sp.]|nr:zf-HC2 domain-containing protein [Cytophagales bacterium]